MSRTFENTDPESPIAYNMRDGETGWQIMEGLLRDDGVVRAFDERIASLAGLPLTDNWSHSRALSLVRACSTVEISTFGDLRRSIEDNLEATCLFSSIMNGIPGRPALYGWSDSQVRPGTSLIHLCYLLAARQYPSAESSHDRVYFDSVVWNLNSDPLTPMVKPDSGRIDELKTLIRAAYDLYAKS
ncbi:MAG: hypothetical protein Q7W51_01920 [Coriobacteriia bacterium]|nr:hypothetical protein [Coriobacteriia bacterium]